MISLFSDTIIIVSDYNSSVIHEEKVEIYEEHIEIYEEEKKSNENFEYHEDSIINNCLSDKINNISKNKVDRDRVRTQLFYFRIDHTPLSIR